MKLASPQPKRVKKFDVIKQRLISTAKVLGPGVKLPTVVQLCRTLEISVTTLDRVLKQLESEGVIVRMHGSGIFVSPSFGRLRVGLVYESLAMKGAPFYGLLTEAVLRRCTESNKKCLFYLNYALEQEAQLPCPHDLYQDVLDGTLNGVITVGVYDKKVFDFLRSHKIPVAALGSVQGISWRVMLNYAELVEKATRRALEEGCRRIGLLLPFYGESPHAGLCRDAYLRTLASAGIEGDPLRLISQYEPDRGEYPQAGFATALRWIREDAVDCIISADDMMTFGVLQALQETGKRVPIISHNNRGSVLAWNTSTVRGLEFDPQKLVAALFELLEEQLLPEVITEPRDIVIHPEWGAL